MRGLTESDHQAQRVQTGRSWADFCDSLKVAGAALQVGSAPQDAFSQAEGYRYLARLTRAGLEAFLEYPDPAFSPLNRLVHETVKIGADNPDNYYMNAQISADYSYKIRGTRNSISFLSFHVFNGKYGSAEGVSVCSEMDATELEIENNEFEINLSQNKSGKNWMKIDPESSMLIVRQTFGDRSKEQIAELELECVGGPEKPQPLKPSDLDDALNMVSLFVGGSAMKFSGWANQFSKHPNTLPRTSDEFQAGAGADKNLVYHHSYYKLEADECLLIETSIPDCPYWNFQINNHWMESLDYRYHRIHINKFNAQYENDGSVRVIVSPQKIDHPNALYTDGHFQGTMLWRWLKPEHELEPSCRVIKLQDLRLS